jgi:hypothetical protein
MPKQPQTFTDYLVRDMRRAREMFPDVKSNQSALQRYFDYLDEQSHQPNATTIYPKEHDVSKQT